MNIHTIHTGDVFATLPKPDPRPRRAGQICDRIRGMILSGQLKIGAKLPTEEKLCQEFAVSRTTLREAIQMLRHSGLLSVSPGRGSYIERPNPEQMLIDFAMVGQLGGLNMPELYSMLNLLLQQGVDKVVSASTEKRKRLYSNLLKPTQNAQEALDAEDAWFLAIARLNYGTTGCLLVRQLLAMRSHSRLKQFIEADELYRTHQLQLRFNSAMAEADRPAASRMLQNYLGHIPLEVTESKTPKAMPLAA